MRPENFRQYAASGVSVFLVIAAVAAVSLQERLQISTEGVLAISGMAGTSLAYLMGLVGPKETSLLVEEEHSSK